MAPRMPRTAKKPAGAFVLGAEPFDKISAVEGLSPPRSMLDAFQEMDDRRLSAEERVRFLKAKYGRKPATR